MMHEPEKSDSAIVAVKPTNKAGRPAAEPVEPRAGAEGNANQQSTRRAQDRESVSQALERVRQAARQRKKETVHRAPPPSQPGDCCGRRSIALKRDAAPGVDGLTWQDYEADLDRRLEDLHARVHGERTGRYRPGGGISRRRTDGSARSRSPRWRTRSSRGRRSTVLNAIYEEDFLGFSYGFRPGARPARCAGRPGGRDHAARR